MKHAILTNLIFAAFMVVHTRGVGGIASAASKARLCYKIILPVFVIFVSFPLSTSAEDRSASGVASELANPNTSLGVLAFPMDFVTYEGDLPGAGDQESFRINFQPSLPYPLGNGGQTKFFLRPLIPIIVDQPVFLNGQFESEHLDLGDISFDAAVGKGFPNGVQVIGGIAGTLPTATSEPIAGDQLRLGPEFFLGRKMKWGFIGALVSHQWDVAGEDYDTSITAGQYFYTIDLKNAWQIQAQPTWSYNHKASSDNKLTLPLGIGISKTIIAGTTPWKFSLQYWHFVESPDDFGPDYQIRLQVGAVVPLPW